MVEGKIICIPGGNYGIGLDTALLFAGHGANIAIVGRNPEKNNQAVEKIEALVRLPFRSPAMSAMNLL